MYEKPSVGIKPFEFVPELLTGEELLNFSLLFTPSLIFFESSAALIRVEGLIPTAHCKYPPDFS